MALPMTAQRTAPRKALFTANRNEVVTSTPLQINDWGTVKMNRVMKPTFSCDFETQEQIDALVWGVVVDSSPSAGSYYTQKDDNFVLLYYY